MIYKLLTKPIYTSNYFLAHNANYGDGYIGSYGGAGFFYECKKHDIFGSLFYFLVVEDDGDAKKIAKLAVKANSIKGIEKINKLITLANQRYFFESQNNAKNGIASTIALKGFVSAILTFDDVKKLKEDKEFECFQCNLNLYQGFYKNLMFPLDLELPVLLFVNEYLASLGYLYVTRKKTQKIVTGSRPTSKIFQEFAYNESLERLLISDFEMLLSKKDVSIAKSIYLTLDNEGYEANLLFAYFQKLSSYFKYLLDYQKILEERDQKAIHATLYPLSDKWIENTSGFNAMLEYAEKHISKEAYSTLLELQKNLQNGEIKQLSNEEFFQTQKDEEGKKIKFKYPPNLFKPDYGYNGLPDFLFSNATGSLYRWNNEKETMVKPLFEINQHFKHGNQDDSILRYMAYRGLIERKLQNEAFSFMSAKTEEGKGEAKRFLEMWSRIPKKYEQLLEITDKKIKNKELDLIAFKQELLSYLDEDQKAFLEKYKDVVISYTSSLPRGNKTIQDGKFIREEVSQEIKDRYKKTFWDYILQIEYEFFTITYLNFSGYFNITFDYILYAKLHNVAVGPGRGSAAGSLIAYLTYITDVDSLQYDLLFERMLHILKDIYDVPDVDSDFAPDNRYDVIEYVKQKFGEDNVAHVGAYQSSAIKGIIKALTKGGPIPFENINMLTKTLGSKDDEIDTNFNAMLEYYEGADADLPPDVTNLLGKYRDYLKPTLNIVKELLGYPKIPSIHACGVIISPVPIEKLSPCRYLPMNRTKIGLFDKNEMEGGGLLKYDFLGLNNMQIIKTTIQSILWEHKELREKYAIHIPDNPEERTSQDWDNLNWYAMYYDIIDNIGTDDEDVYEQVFQTGNSTGIFQFESEGMRRVLKGIRPDCITELSDLCAIYRPGPMASIPDYKSVKFEGATLHIYPDEFLQEMEYKYGKDEVYKNVNFFEEVWRKISQETKGILVYQEQLMSFFNVLGHSYTDADFIRKIFSKIKGGKKSFKDLEKYYDKTMKLLQEQDIKQDFFDYIYYEILVDWASYGFNKSHAVSYGIIAYITGWLKTKYPYHYYATILRGFESNPTKVAKVINEMNILGIDIVGPDLFKSLKHAIIK